MSPPCYALLEDVDGDTIVCTDRTPRRFAYVSATMATLIEHRFTSKESAKKYLHTYSPTVCASVTDE